MENKYKELEKYPDILTLNQTSDYLGVSRDTIRNLCIQGRFKHVRIGRLYKFTKKDLIEFIENKA